MLNKQQIIQNIEAMESQGASQEEIQEYLNSLSGLPAKKAEVKEEPKKGVGRKVADFFTGSEQGAAKATSAIKSTFSSEQALSQSQSSQKLIEQAKKLPMGDPRRKNLLEQANKLANQTVGQAQERQVEIPSQGQAGMDLAFTGLDIITAGTFSKGMKSGQLALKTPTLLKGTEKLGEKITTKLGERTASKNLPKIAEIVTPKLSAKQAAKAASRQGVAKTGLLGTIKTNVADKTLDIAKTVQKYVPDFNPSKTIADNLNATKSALTDIAQTLKDDVIKSGKDKIYTFKELNSKMLAIPKPIVIKSDKVLTRQFDLVREAALKIARRQGGKISDLLDARKAFDDLVEKQFPNLYDRANAPMRDAIRGMRGVMNDFIADNVQDVAFKESLQIQSRLFSAIDNMADNIASGPLKELGTNALSRFAKRNPTLTRTAKYVAAGAAGGLGLKALDD